MHCISCNETQCFACETGYSLAFGGLRCMDCATTYPGCLLCVNGVCAGCDEDQGFELGHTMCICKPGRYRKDLRCLPYRMGSSIQRLFEGSPSFSQNMDTNRITI